MDLWTCLSGEPLANHSQSADSEKEWVTTVATWPSNFADLLIEHAPAGSFGKTCLERSLPTEEEISGQSPLRWFNSGIASPGECWTLKVSEATHTLAPLRSDESACSLWDILETTGEFLLPYSLSGKECASMLRRGGFPPLMMKYLSEQVSRLRAESQAPPL